VSGHGNNGPVSHMAMRRAALCVALVLTSAVVSLPAVALEAGSHVAFAPRQGPVGTLITIRGHLTRSDQGTFARANSVTLYIVAGQSNAGLETSVAGNMRLGQSGGFTLSFRLPDRTDWRANPDEWKQRPSCTHAGSHGC
jgi:hypothetical protein